MKILLGLSGGVDSAFAAASLRDAGHDVECAVVIMSEYNEVEQAQKIADKLSLPIHIIDARDAFKKHVIDNFVSEYAQGRTPNPCVMCNRYIKIEYLCDYAEKHGFERIATGHYVSVKEKDGRFAVCRAADLKKDQSYMLWQLTQKQLSMLMTPLSNSTKADARAGVARFSPSTAQRPDSQEICFIPDNDHAAFIEKRLGKFPEGDYIDTNGKVLGRHKGIIHYTIGQRKGLGIALGEPYFVQAIDQKRNTVTLVPAGGEGCRGMIVDDLNFQRILPNDAASLRLTVKIRYAAQPVGCTANIRGKSASVTFDDPIRFITPGQSAVFYLDDEVAFGGFIQSSL